MSSRRCSGPSSPSISATWEKVGPPGLQEPFGRPTRAISDPKNCVFRPKNDPFFPRILGSCKRWTFDHLFWPLRCTVVGEWGGSAH